ncbi:Cupredoxin [Trichodelitschia bisporula]|uniref:Cupredoxin n=1 Tax=Trichodelitschia bisporula TaxID=703511 RepID=A0A6G1HYE1_9PEZI|nr:Cupredoxin [Trichodelitschia bisporula]
MSPTSSYAAALATLLAFASPSLAAEKAPYARLSPAFNSAWKNPLPIPEIKKPLTSIKNPDTGAPIDFYEIEVKSFKHKFFPNLQEADLVGYDGAFPGPVFHVEKGRETVVRVVNRDADRLGRAPWDGWANDGIPSGHYKDYYYPNAAARMLWYHDHINKESAINAYRGLVGVYNIIDSTLDKSLNLPTGAYDIPLVLTAHYFTPSGGLSNERAEHNSIYGDTFLVNGAIQPALAVEPRKYRFRILNAAVSRVFNLTLTDDKGAVVPVAVVGSDGGYRAAPAAARSLLLGMAERWEVVVDFKGLEGKALTLATHDVWTDAKYKGSGEMLRFNVERSVKDTSGNELPKSFGVDLRFPSGKAVKRQMGGMGNMGGMMGGMGNMGGMGGMGGMMGGMGGMGGMMGDNLKWTHALHMHLVDIQLISRRKDNASLPEGRSYLEPYEVGSVKDTIVLGSNEVVEVLAKFTPYPGVYMFHCHNFVHSDQGMMAAFNVTRLADMGYSELEARLEDPMDARFRSKAYTGTNLDEVRTKVLPMFAGLKAYPDIRALEKLEDKYWAAKTAA